MRKVHVLIVFILVSSVAIAQKIKVKKDKLYIDKEEVPINVGFKNLTEHEGKFVKYEYVFSNAKDNSVIFGVNYTGERILGGSSWMDLISKDGKVNSIDSPIKGNFTKSLILYLINDVKFFDVNGVVNQKNIDDFFAQTTVSEEKIKELGTDIVEQPVKPLVATTPLEVDIDIKKDIVYFDKNETSIKVEIKYVDKADQTKTHAVLTYTDVANNSVFAIVDWFSINGEMAWVSVSDKEKSQVSEADFEFVIKTLSVKKLVTAFLMKNLNFFDTDGNINYDVIREFIEKESKSDKKEKYKREIEADKLAREIYVKDQLNVESDRITRKDSNGDYINVGYIKTVDYLEFSEITDFPTTGYSELIYDEQDNIIAGRTINQSGVNIVIVNRGGKKFSYKNDLSVKDSAKDDELIIKIIAYGGRFPGVGHVDIE